MADKEFKVRHGLTVSGSQGVTSQKFAVSDGEHIQSGGANKLALYAGNSEAFVATPTHIEVGTNKDLQVKGGEITNPAGDLILSASTGNIKLSASLEFADGTTQETAETPGAANTGSFVFDENKLYTVNDTYLVLSSSVGSRIFVSGVLAAGDTSFQLDRLNNNDDNPRILFDLGDYIYYQRGSDFWDFTLANADKMRVKAEGVVITDGLNVGLGVGTTPVSGTILVGGEGRLTANSSNLILSSSAGSQVAVSGNLIVPQGGGTNEGGSGIAIGTATPFEALTIFDGNFLFQGSTERQIFFKHTGIDGNPQFKMGRIIASPPLNAPEFRLLYSDDSNSEFAVLSIESSGTVASIKKVVGSHFEGFIAGQEKPFFRLNSFPSMSFQFGRGDTYETDVDLIRRDSGLLAITGSSGSVGTLDLHKIYNSQANLILSSSVGSQVTVSGNLKVQDRIESVNPLVLESDAGSILLSGTVSAATGLLSARGVTSGEGFQAGRKGNRIFSVIDGAGPNVRIDQPWEFGWVSSTILDGGDTDGVLVISDNAKSSNMALSASGGTIASSGHLVLSSSVGSQVFISGNLQVDGTINTPNTAGPALLNEASTQNNPTLLPNRTVTNAGIGFNGGVLGFVVGGIGRVLLTTTQLTSNVDIAVGSGNFLRLNDGQLYDGSGHLVLSSSVGSIVHVSGALSLPSVNDATSPTIQFGDGDTGFYEASDDNIDVAIAGSRNMSFTPLGIKADSSTGAQVSTGASSATTPTLIPRRSDTTTGIGAAGNGNLSLIAGSTEAIRISSTDVVVLNNLYVSGTQFAVSSSDLVVSDPLIVVAQSQSGTPTYDAGFIVNRGTEENVGMIWDESANEFGLVRTTDDGSTFGGIVINGYRDLRISNLYMTTGSINGTATFVNDVSFSSDATFNGNMHVSGTLALSQNAILLDPDNNSEISAVGNNFIDMRPASITSFRFTNTGNRSELDLDMRGNNLKDTQAHLTLSSSVDSIVNISGNLRIYDATDASNITIPQADGNGVRISSGDAPFADGPSLFITGQNGERSARIHLDDSIVFNNGGGGVHMSVGPGHSGVALSNAAYSIYNTVGHLILSSSAGSIVKISGNLEMGIGNQIYLDDDNDTYLYALSDDSARLVAGGSSVWTGTASTLNVHQDLALTSDTSRIVNNSGHLILSSSVGSTVHVSGNLSLPQVNDAASPTLAFGDGDTGIYESSDDNLAVSIAGTARFAWSGGSFNALGANAPALINNNASATNPNIRPNRADIDSGIGQSAADQLSLIAGGVETLRLNAAGEIFSVTQDLILSSSANSIVALSATLKFPDGTTQSTAATAGEVTGSTNFFVDEVLRVPQRNSASSPSIQFGDGNTGFYEQSDNTLQVSTAGTAKFQWQSTYYGGVTSGAGVLINEAATATNPTFIPRGPLDLDTGVGSAGDDQLSLIAGSQEGLRLTEVNGNVVTASFDHASLNTVVRLPQNNNANSPTLQFGDGDTGFYEAADDSFVIGIGGTARWNIVSNLFRSNTNGGPQLIDQAAGATTPTIIANRPDLNTGLGSPGQDELSLIAGGIEILRLQQTGSLLIAPSGHMILSSSAGSQVTISGTILDFAEQSAEIRRAGNTLIRTIGGGSNDLSIDQFVTLASGGTIAGDVNVTTNSKIFGDGHLILSSSAGSIVHISGNLKVPGFGAVASPSIQFGDGDTGFYESFDDALYVAVGATNTFQFRTTYFGDINTDGPRMLNGSSTTTSPTLIPYGNDTNTGIGGDGFDTLSLIAGGAEGISITEFSNNARVRIDSQIYQTALSESVPGGTTQTINWDAGMVQTIDLASASSDVTLTFSFGRPGGQYALKIIQDVSTPRNIVWPSTVKWQGGATPIISTGSLAIDMVTFICDGTDYYTNIGQDFS